MAWAVWLVAIFLEIGCSDDPQCKFNSDCPKDTVCHQGKCIENIIDDSESDSFGDGDTDSDTDSDADSDAETDADSDSHTDTARFHECDSPVDCESNNPCSVAVCNKTGQWNTCEEAPLLDDTPCDNNDPCDGIDVCLSGECISQGAPCETLEEVNGCFVRRGTCNVESGSPLCVYTDEPIDDGTGCLKNDPCNQGSCESGECINVQNPCRQENSSPCFVYQCETTGTSIGEFSCNNTELDDFTPCAVSSSIDPCFGTELGYCYETECIPSPQTPCFDMTTPNICTAQRCTPADGSCQPVENAATPTAVTCSDAGDVILLTENDFKTREYGNYTPQCRLPFNQSGFEAALSLSVSGDINVSVEVSGADEGDWGLYLLTDMCDEGSCQLSALNQLTIPSMTGTDVIIVEAGNGPPPASMELTFTCN